MTVKRHLIEIPGNRPAELPIVATGAASAHSSCDACLAIVASTGDPVHAADCAAARAQTVALIAHRARRSLAETWATEAIALGATAPHAELVDAYLSGFQRAERACLVVIAREAEAVERAARAITTQRAAWIATHR